MAQPVADRAFVAEREAKDHRERAIARNIPPFATDHEHDLAFVVELLRHFGAHQRPLMARERIREADEQVRIFRLLAFVFVLGRALGIVDADADDLLRLGHGRKKFHLRELYIRLAARGFARLFHSAGADQIDETGIASAQARAQIDDARRRNGAEKLAVFDLEGAKSECRHRAKLARKTLGSSKLYQAFASR